MMKKTSTAAFTLALSVAVPSTAGDCFLRSPCAPSCVTAPACAAEVTTDSPISGGLSAHDMGGTDNPSELNVALTTELLALRDQVAAATQSLDEKDAAISEADDKLASLGKQLAGMKADLAAQTERAENAEQQLASAREEASKAAKAAQQQRNKLQQQAASMKKEMEAETNELQQQLTSAKSNLDKANAALEQERKKREDERRQQEQKAATMVKDEEEAASPGNDEKNAED